MKIVNYESILPRLDSDPSYMLKALTKKLPRYMKKGLFDVADFLQVFAQSIHGIISNLPDDPDLRKEMEIDLAYIMHDLYVNQDIIIIRDNKLRNIRSVELGLDREGLLSEYLAFARGTQKNIDISEPKYFLQFLDYLASYIPNGIHDVKLYLEACINLSQIGEEGMNILLVHLRKMFSYMPMEEIDDMIGNHGYLGKQGENASERIRTIMKDERVSYNQATILLRDFQEGCAGLHLYFEGIYDAYVKPRLFTISAKEQINIKALFNDFHDIVDPGYYVPFFLENENVAENLEREKIVQEGKVLH